MNNLSIFTEHHFKLSEPVDILVHDKMILNNYNSIARDCLNNRVPE